MKIEKSKTGRKIILQNATIPHDFGGKYRKELIDSYYYEQEEKFFLKFAKILITLLILFVIGVAISYHF